MANIFTTKSRHWYEIITAYSLKHMYLEAEHFHFACESESGAIFAGLENFSFINAVGKS